MAIIAWTSFLQDLTGFEEVYFFSKRAVNRWNELDEDTVSSTTVNMFKNRLQRIRQLKTSFYTDT